MSELATPAAAAPPEKLSIKGADEHSQKGLFEKIGAARRAFHVNHSRDEVRGGQPKMFTGFAFYGDLYIDFVPGRLWADLVFAPAAIPIGISIGVPFDDFSAAARFHNDTSDLGFPHNAR